MRPELLRPVSEKKRLKMATELVERIYLLHEHGKKKTDELRQLSDVVGRTVSDGEACGAFGSIDAKDWANDLLQDDSDIPTDLSRTEMIELFDSLRVANGTTSQQSYWIKVLAKNTRDDSISDLIFWPNEYFEDDDLHREMTSEQMLDTALRTGSGHERLPPELYSEPNTNE